MKKLLVLSLILLAAACSVDNEMKSPVAAVPDDPTMNDIDRPTDAPRLDANGRINVECPISREWKTSFTSATMNTGPLTSSMTFVLQYAINPILAEHQPAGLGFYGGTFTFQLKNTGTLIMKYMYNSSVGYLTLAPGATTTYTTPFIQRNCNSLATPVNNKIYFKSGNCTGQYYWLLGEVKLIGVTGTGPTNHTISPLEVPINYPGYAGTPETCFYP